MRCQESTIDGNLLTILKQIASSNLELKSKSVLDSCVLKYSHKKLREIDNLWHKVRKIRLGPPFAVFLADLTQTNQTALIHQRKPKKQKWFQIHSILENHQFKKKIVWESQHNFSSLWWVDSSGEKADFFFQRQKFTQWCEMYANVDK
jgi:hypothetical protein